MLLQQSKSCCREVGAENKVLEILIRQLAGRKRNSFSETIAIRRMRLPSVTSFLIEVFLMHGALCVLRVASISVSVYVSLYESFQCGLF